MAYIMNEELFFIDTISRLQFLMNHEESSI